MQVFEHFQKRSFIIFSAESEILMSINYQDNSLRTEIFLIMFGFGTSSTNEKQNDSLIKNSNQCDPDVASLELQKIFAISLSMLLL